MNEFNPYEPAVLHDAEDDTIVTWDWERADEYKQKAFLDSEGKVYWDGRVFDGWGEALGG